MKPALQNILLLFISVLLLVLVLEGALRIAKVKGSVRHTEADPLLSHRFRKNFEYPNKSIDYNVMIKTNSMGFRDNEFDDHKPEGTVRLMVLGDSFTAANQVELEETFHSILEKRLSEDGRKVELLSFGVPAYGNARQWLIYKLWAKKFKVDGVIWMIFAFNDPSDNADFIDKGYPWPGMENFRKKLEEAKNITPPKKRRSINKWLDDHSYFYRWQKLITKLAAIKVMIMLDMEVAKIGHLVSMFLEPELEENARKWDITDTVLKGFAEELKEDDMPAVVAIWLPEIMADENRFDETISANGYDPEKFSVADTGKMLERMKATLRAAGMEPIDLTDNLLKTWRSGTDVSFKTDGHWNRAGHRLVADILEPEVRRKILQ